MKVLHVIPSLPSVRGGPSQAIVEMVHALRTYENVEAEIATTNDNGVGLLEVPLNRQILYKGVPVRFFARFSPRWASLREFAFSYPLTQWLWKNVRNYDTVHVHAIFSYPSTVAMKIARMQGVPYFVRPLGQLCEWPLQQSARKKELYLRMIERANLNGSAGLHLTSVQEHEEISTLGLMANSFIIPHGLQFPRVFPQAPERLRSHFNLPPDEPIVLFLSRLHPKKGIDYLLKALSQLKRQRLTLILAGNGTPEYEQNIRDLIVQLGLGDRVIMTGFVQGDLKQMLLQGSSIFVLPSHSENFGVAVLEALAASLPVVVTPGVALSRIVTEHHFGQVASLAPDDIANSITSLLTDADRLAAMGSAAKAFIENQYAWDKVAGSIVKMYVTSVCKP